MGSQGKCKTSRELRSELQGVETLETVWFRKVNVNIDDWWVEKLKSFWVSPCAVSFSAKRWRTDFLTNELMPLLDSEHHFRSRISLCTTSSPLWRDETQSSRRNENYTSTGWTNTEREGWSLWTVFSTLPSSKGILEGLIKIWFQASALSGGTGSRRVNDVSEQRGAAAAG